MILKLDCDNSQEEKLMPSTILIVDDEDSGRETLQSILEGEGYNLVMAENGPQAGARA